MDGKRNTVCGGYLWSCVMPFLVYSSWWRPRFGGEGEVCFSGDDFLVCSQRETESNFLRRNSLIDLTSGTKNGERESEG
jgi:hypothetical protein